MIKRNSVKFIKTLAEMFPAVIIIGPRQSGKTTLVKNFIKGEYYDLEKPSDIQVFLPNAEYGLSKAKKPLIIDEVQHLPEIFNVLRSLIDENRKKNGQFYLLGSVNPFLLKDVSESLAGRVGVAELTPFLYDEIKQKVSFDDLWLKGAYPDAVLEKDVKKWALWEENYIRTFIERDIVRHGINMSSTQMRTMLMMLANIHGNLINASELGKSMGLSYHTVNKYLDILESYFLIRRLQPFHVNIKKRLVKASKFYFRDSGILHSLLRISNSKDLLENHRRGSSWEGFIIEQVINREKLFNPSSNFYFFRTHAGLEVDLIIEKGAKKTGIEVKLANSITHKDYQNIDTLIKDGLIDNGIILYKGERFFNVTDKIQIIPAEKYLSEQ